MTDSIRRYAKLGLVQHMLWPDCNDYPARHAEMLGRFLERGDIETFDFCVPYAEPYRTKAADCVKASSLDKCYSLHLFPSRKISLASADVTEQEITKLVLRDQIAMAAECGANGFVFVSGADIPEDRAAAIERFETFCLWFCEELAPYGMTALLEPFDRTFDKKYLMGTIEESASLCERVRARGGNMAIELDIAHLPLMGEDLVSAIRRCGGLIERVHLGNCVMRDPNSRWYGDIHPPIGFPNGEIGLAECRTVLQTLYNIGYLSKENRRPLILEMRPTDGDNSVEKTIADAFALLEQAWADVTV